MVLAGLLTRGSQPFVRLPDHCPVLILKPVAQPLTVLRGAVRWFADPGLGHLHRVPFSFGAFASHDEPKPNTGSHKLFERVLQAQSVIAPIFFSVACSEHLLCCPPNGNPSVRAAFISGTIVRIEMINPTESSRSPDCKMPDGAERQKIRRQADRSQSALRETLNDFRQILSQALWTIFVGMCPARR